MAEGNGTVFDGHLKASAGYQRVIDWLMNDKESSDKRHKEVTDRLDSIDNRLKTLEGNPLVRIAGSVKGGFAVLVAALSVVGSLGGVLWGLNMASQMFTGHSINLNHHP